MQKMLNAIGVVPRVIVTILGVMVAGLVVLALLILASGAIGAFQGALALAIMVATLMGIVYLVARIFHKPAAPAIPPPPPPPPGYSSQPYPLSEEQVHNPYDLR